jgi:hypothetical protein
VTRVIDFDFILTFFDILVAFSMMMRSCASAVRCAAPRRAFSSLPSLNQFTDEEVKKNKKNNIYLFD